MHLKGGSDDDDDVYEDGGHEVPKTASLITEHEDEVVRVEDVSTVTFYHLNLNLQILRIQTPNS